ncbi:MULTISPECIES: cupin domain-containing protein [Streptomyces]|uniref:cupin domain-containing protein n=1 Tax=Streptomyces TaxID=1883 RepID=UPI00163C2E26|nr:MULTISPECIES: cupin domain-containing protein [Streptomyces]MBC2875867.1 cupin domain-containing protein [Streptomyces sp. TYQ1024]UBI37714.1 cupin domain-containing protein [Streptomyces mobaraensis]UKW30300.1 cupin domain-containing protein [Streptomyces sp. TYQ1024]
MSFLSPDYPEVLYDRDKGELSASFRPVDTPPDYTAPNGNTYHYLSTKLSTNGLFGLYKNRMGPAVGGTSPHFHKTMSEAFYVLSGEIHVFDGEQWFDASEGDYLYIPPGGVHSFGNISGEPAEFLMLFAPGGAREAYFEGLEHLGSMTDDERAEFLVRHDSFFADMTKGPGADSWERRASLRKSFKTQ